MEKAKKRVYGRREVRMFLAYDENSQKAIVFPFIKMLAWYPKGYHCTMLLGLY